MNLKNWLVSKMAEETGAEQSTATGGQAGGESSTQTTETASATDTGDEAQSPDNWDELLAEDEPPNDELAGETHDDEKPAPKPEEKPQPSTEQPAPKEPQAQESKPAEKPAETPVPRMREQLEEEARTAYAKREGELKEFYKLPKELAEKLETEPENVLPDLAAKMHQAVLAEARAMIADLVPQALRYHREVETRESQAKDAFYGQWPQLRDRLTDAEPLVFHFGEVISKTNPNLPSEERIKQIGRLVCTTLGLPVSQEQGGGSSPSAAAPETKPPAAKPGFRPASPGSLGSTATRPRTDNEYEGLSYEFDQEDGRAA